MTDTQGGIEYEWAQIGEEVSPVLRRDRAAIQALTDPGVPWPAARAAVQAIPEQRLHQALGLGPADVDDCTCFVTAESMWTTHYGAVEPGSMMEWNPECAVHRPAPVKRHPIVRVRLVAQVMDGYRPTVIYQWRAECIRGGRLGTPAHELPGYSHTWRWFGEPVTLDGTAWAQGMADLGQQIDRHIWEAHGG